jgi:predicted nucleic acid-binding protein
MDIMVDSNVILDVITEDSVWYQWSAEMLASCADTHDLVINHIIYAEVSVSFDRIEDLEFAIPVEFYRRDLLPWEAAFLAAKCFLQYRRQGGKGLSPLPDFYIGAHAAVAGMALLTRDASRYKRYFPKVKLICPEET